MKRIICLSVFGLILLTLGVSADDVSLQAFLPGDAGTVLALKILNLRF